LWGGDGSCTESNPANDERIEPSQSKPSRRYGSSDNRTGDRRGSSRSSVRPLSKRHERAVGVHTFQGVLSRSLVRQVAGYRDYDYRPSPTHAGHLHECQSTAVAERVPEVSFHIYLCRCELVKFWL